MRISMTFTIAAAALLAASPAVAQNIPVADNSTAVTTINTADANAAMPADAAMLPGDQNAVLPIDDNVGAVDMGGAPEPREKHGFPWGVLGLIGLIGLIPRVRRS